MTNFIRTSYGRIKLIKIISPIICQNDFAGFANENNSTITLFHKSFPTNATIRNARVNDKRVATVSAYTSRFIFGFVSAKPSTAARQADVIADISIRSRDYKFLR